jgi:hypothetical protein
MDVPPIADWEDELGRLMAHRAVARLEEGGDLDAELACAERGMTAGQRRMLRHALRLAARRPTA